jgi:hypothetical protein
MPSMTHNKFASVQGAVNSCGLHSSRRSDVQLSAGFARRSGQLLQCSEPINLLGNLLTAAESDVSISSAPRSGHLPLPENPFLLIAPTWIIYLDISTSMSPPVILYRCVAGISK